VPLTSNELFRLSGIMSPYEFFITHVTLLHTIMQNLTKRTKDKSISISTLISTVTVSTHDVTNLTKPKYLPMPIPISKVQQELHFTIHPNTSVNNRTFNYYTTIH
jgi:hypothetical protein